MMANTTNSQPVEEKEEMNLKDELIAAHEDEASDVEKYMKLAELADEKYPSRGYGSILRDIGKEESVHKKHIKLILEDMSKWEGEEDG
jgi:rubrerythrin